MATIRPQYRIVWVAITFGGIRAPFCVIEINEPSLNSGDVLDFGNTFSTDIKDTMEGIVTGAGVFWHDLPGGPTVNPWGFTTNTKLQDGDPSFRIRTAVSPGGRYRSGDIATYLEYYLPGSSYWQRLNLGGSQSGGYVSNDNYYCNPAFLIRNSATNKYLYPTMTSGSATYYGTTDPGIVNNNGMCSSYITGTPYNMSVRYTVGGQLILQNIEDLRETDDPYNPGGESGTGGGTGDFDGTSDSVDIPNLPSLSAVDTGFISLFNPSASELKSLANYMWGNLFDVDTWKKIFANPMDAILGLSIVPVNVPAGGSETVSVGNISTGISMTKASSQYVAVDCGTLNVNEYWGAYLDYDPYTKAEIYLPFIGTHPLAVDDIMGKSVHVVYHVDILSGSCCAYIKCGNSVLYSFVGQCSCSIPITGNDWTNVVNGALSIAASIGTMVATGGASAPMAVTNIASTAVNSLKPNVEKSGSMGGMGGMLGIQKPYLILTRPRQALPFNQNAYMGYPSFITMDLSDCSGYTEVESIHLDSVPATESELAEIETLLKSGVII